VVLDVVAAARHVVNDGIGVDANTVGAASLDEAAEGITRAAATLKVVSNGLVVEVPGVELTFLGPFVRHDGLHGGENLDSHPSHFAEGFALSLNVSMRPAKQLNDTTLLAILVGGVLLDGGVLPDEVGGFERNRELGSVAISGLYGEGKSLSEGGGGGVSVGGNVAFVVPVVGNIDD
jgi:hypothetical protein